MGDTIKNALAKNSLTKNLYNFSCLIISLDVFSHKLATIARLASKFVIWTRVGTKLATCRRLATKFATIARVATKLATIARLATKFATYPRVSYTLLLALFCCLDILIPISLTLNGLGLRHGI